VKYFILPLEKSPHQTGRIGQMESQDWYQGLVRAKNLLEEFPGSKILVVTATQITDEKPAADLYLEALKKFGVKEENIKVVREGLETIGQIEAAQKVARQEQAKLHVVSTFMHYPRVRWIMRGQGAKHYGVFGIPRPREAVTDIILTFIFPFIDLWGWREKFVKKVTKRREEGRL
jgi:hypothetical protein